MFSIVICIIILNVGNAISISLIMGSDWCIFVECGWSNFHGSENAFIHWTELRTPISYHRVVQSKFNKLIYINCVYIYEKRHVIWGTPQKSRISLPRFPLTSKWPTWFRQIYTACHAISYMLLSSKIAQITIKLLQPPTGYHYLFLLCNLRRKKVNFWRFLWGNMKYFENRVCHVISQVLLLNAIVGSFLAWGTKYFIVAIMKNHIGT